MTETITDYAKILRCHANAWLNTAVAVGCHGNNVEAIDWDIKESLIASCVFCTVAAARPTVAVSNDNDVYVTATVEQFFTSPYRYLRALADMNFIAAYGLRQGESDGLSPTQWLCFAEFYAEGVRRFFTPDKQTLRQVRHLPLTQAQKPASL